jgi:cytochrome P450
MSISDASEHNKRRRVWDRAFTPAALKSYVPMLSRRLTELVVALDAHLNTSLDIAEWLGFFTVDFMGDFACGGAFNLLERGKDEAGYHAIAMDGLGLAEALGKIPWCRAFIHHLPNNDLGRILSFSLGVAERRKATGSLAKDLFYHLVGTSY